jgi:hypothetical protein
LKIINAEVPKILRDNGVPEIIVENVKLRLDHLANELATLPGGISCLTKEQVYLVHGVIDGACLVLYSGGHITSEQFRNIINTWSEKCRSFDMN